MTVNVQPPETIEPKKNRNVTLTGGDAYLPKHLQMLWKVLLDHLLDVGITEHTEASMMCPPFIHERSDGTVIGSVPVGEDRCSVNVHIPSAIDASGAFATRKCRSTGE
jgi:hypothetical protein